MSKEFFHKVTVPIYFSHRSRSAAHSAHAPGVRRKVNRDSAPRRAWRWNVQSDVGGLCSKSRSRVAGRKRNQCESAVRRIREGRTEKRERSTPRSCSDFIFFVGWHGHRYWLARTVHLLLTPWMYRKDSPHQCAPCALGARAHFLELTSFIISALNSSE